VRELPFELIATCLNCEEFAFHKGSGHVIRGVRATP